MSPLGGLFMIEVGAHYERIWGVPSDQFRLRGGPMRTVNPEFQVLEFPPGPARRVWIYATLGMSIRSPSSKPYGIEVHLLSPVQYLGHVELLTALAFFHHTGRPLDLGSTMNLGRPWLPQSACSHGLLAAPYLDVRAAEWVQSRSVRCLWLVPITAAEREFHRHHGLDALEKVFEQSPAFNYLDPARRAVV
jgi:Suppressor of fused protein (SUFU)